MEPLFDDLIARGRATAADLEWATGAIASGARTEESLVSEWAPLALEDGATVTLKGLKSRPELNGREATVLEFRSSSRRFALKLTGSGNTIAAKRENITEAAAGADVLSASKLGPDLAGYVGSFLTCTRCLEPCTGSKCRVEHPAHLREDLGSVSGPEGMRSHFACKACGQQYDVLTPWSSNGVGTMEMGEPQIVGARWCYAGVCTTIPLPPSDKRRVMRGFAALKAGPQLQEEIDALPADTETLTIMSDGFYDDDSAVVLERHLSKLTELQLVDVCFDKIVLNEALTPLLQHLRMQNVPNECDLTVEAPRLKSVSIHFLGDCDDVINTMLAHATELESFDSYKLWVHELHFASNNLASVDLHRSDALDTLTLYAPNLVSLGLQACYGLETLTFRASHPTLSSLLPAGHTPPPLEVNTTNANLGRAARKALREHPSAGPSRTCHQGMPTEAMFAGMNGMMGGMGDADPWGDEYDDDDDDDDDFDGMPPGFAGMEGMSPDVLRMLRAMMGGMGAPSEGLDDDYDDDYDDDCDEDDDEDDDDGEDGAGASASGGGGSGAGGGFDFTGGSGAAHSFGGGGGSSSTPSFGGGSSTPSFGGGSSTPSFGGGGSAPSFGGGGSAPSFGSSAAPATGAQFGQPASAGFGGSTPSFGGGNAAAPSFGGGGGGFGGGGGGFGAGAGAAASGQFANSFGGATQGQGQSAGNGRKHAKARRKKKK